MPFPAVSGKFQERPEVMTLMVNKRIPITLIGSRSALMKKGHTAPPILAMALAVACPVDRISVESISDVDTHVVQLAPIMHMRAA